MSEILLYYRRPDPTTWVYLSSFLTIGLFFVFHRFWSIRNVDILLLILLAPGLLMVHEGYRRQLIESETLARQKGQRSEDDRPQDQGREALLRLGTVGCSAGSLESRNGGIAGGGRPRLCDRTDRCCE